MTRGRFIAPVALPTGEYALDVSLDVPSYGHLPSLDEFDSIVSAIALIGNSLLAERQKDVRLIAGAVKILDPDANTFITGSLSAGEGVYRESCVIDYSDHRSCPNR